MTLNVTVTDGYGQGELAPLSTNPYSLKILQYPSIGLDTEIPSSIVFNINLPTNSKYFVKGAAVPGQSAASQNADLLASTGSKFQSTKQNIGETGTVAALATVAGIQAFGSSGGLVSGAAAGGSAFAKAAVTGGASAIIAEGVS